MWLNFQSCNFTVQDKSSCYLEGHDSKRLSEKELIVRHYDLTKDTKSIEKDDTSIEEILRVIKGVK